MQLEINGVKVIYHTAWELERFGLDPNQHPEWLILSPCVVCVNVFNKRDLLLLANHNVDKIDYAVPQEWLDVQMKREERWPDTACNHYGWAWSYENDDIFGHPLNMDVIVHQVKQRLFLEWQKHVVDPVTV